MHRLKRVIIILAATFVFLGVLGEPGQDDHSAYRGGYRLGTARLSGS